MAYKLNEISNDELDNFVLESISGPISVVEFPYLTISANLRSKFSIEATAMEIDKSLKRLREQRKIMPRDYSVRLIESLGSRLL